ALGLARRDGRADREQLARDHIAALEPKLSRTTISLAPRADVPGLHLSIDADDIPRAAWETPIPVDPGGHTLTAAAPGKRRWQSPFAIASGAPETKTIVVPPLEPEETPPA